MSSEKSNNSTANSPRRSPRRAASSATSSAVHTLQYEEEEKIDEVGGEDNANPEKPSQPFAFKSAKIFCDVDNCPGRGHLPAQTCFLCEADIHIECFLGTVRKLKEYPDGCHDEVFCSDVCCLWHGNPEINVDEVRRELLEHSKLLKKQLIELAWIAKVRVTHHVDKKSLQVSKAMMLCRLLAKKFNAEAGIAVVAATLSRPEKTIKVHFRLINCIFSDDLS